jgi:hypothetical protein
LHPYWFRSFKSENKWNYLLVPAASFIGVWHRAAMDSLKFHPDPPCPTLLRSVGWSPLNQPYGRFRGGPTARRAACSRLLPFWTPRAERLGRHSRTKTGFSNMIGGFYRVGNSNGRWAIHTIAIKKRLSKDLPLFHDVYLSAKETWAYGKGWPSNSLNFHPGPLCPTLLCPAGGPPLKQPYGRFKGGSPAGRAPCGHLLPL